MATELMTTPSQDILERLGKLTDGQRACLRGVLGMKTSKQIGAELGISPHTVDKRLKDAMRLLGTSTRAGAAQMLLAERGEPYQPLVYQLPDLDVPVPRGASPTSEQSGTGPGGPASGDASAASPAPPVGDRRNTLGPWQRLAIIVAIAILAPMLLGAVASGMMLAQQFYDGAR